jgi:CheY-like chemotaxis protein
MTELLRELLGEGVTIETVLGVGVGNVAADPEELKAAILNLVVNARNALPARGRVTLETANVSAAQIGPAGPITEAKPPEEGEFVMIAVLDSGIGMTSEIVAKAFSPCGLEGASPEVGISQVHSFVRQAGGHLRVETSPARGTVVRVYLPFASGPSAASRGAGTRKPGAAASDAPAGEVKRDLTGLRVLVVEDESLIAMHVESLLEEVGCATAQVVASVEEALAAVARADFDLALLDINVGKELVYPVADALKARNIPFIFMSGLAAIEERWAEQPRLRKPFELEQLCEAMRCAQGGGRQ